MVNVFGFRIRAVDMELCAWQTHRPLLFKGHFRKGNPAIFVAIAVVNGLNIRLAVKKFSNPRYGNGPVFIDNHLRHLQLPHQIPMSWRV